MSKRATALCECGCGNQTPLATYSASKYGITKGQPLRFIPGHQNRKSPVDYVEEDRSYTTPCWVWKLSKDRGGYGRTRRGTSGRGAQTAHRFYYQERFGTLPAGQDLHHLCGVRDCVNPDHLEPLPEVEHLRRHASLTVDDVREIRRRYVPRVVTRRMLAEEFGTTERNVKHIIAGTTWQEVTA